VQRLGKNIGGYHGEKIDIDAVLQQIDAAAVAAKWTRAEDFPAWRRVPANERARIYVSSGMHGDEPAGPLAVLRLLHEDAWPADAALWLCPCLNPAGFRLHRRENAEGIDINRDYRRLQTAEARAHTDWLQRQPAFDVTLCLHEDWESNGFYLYELNPDNQPSFAEKIIGAVAEVCPIDTSPVIENWPANGGVLRPNLKPAERPQWAEAIYLISRKTRQSYTLEAPSDFPLAVRVDALTVGVRTVLRYLQEAARDEPAVTEPAQW
jgi:predicted deacylase